MAIRTADDDINHNCYETLVNVGKLIYLFKFDRKIAPLEVREPDRAPPSVAINCTILLL